VKRFSFLMISICLPRSRISLVSLNLSKL